MAQRKPGTKQAGKPRKKSSGPKVLDQFNLRFVIASNLKNMICVAGVCGTMLGVLLSVAKCA